VVGLAWIAFWGSLALVAYTYAGFPLLLLALSRLGLRRPVEKTPDTPKLSLVIAAYNEEATLERRLENALGGDYPPDRLEVLLASDGSTDATEAIAAGFESRGVQLLRLPRRGKVHALDDAARRATGDVLVFSDANTFLEPGALRALAENLADPGVGGVVGNTGYRIREDAESSGRGESLYWRYDQWLKELESRTGSVVSAHGGLYAVRRELYRRPPDPAVTDDFAISTAVVVQGYRLVFEPAARGWEETAPQAGGEFRRRVRLMTRGLRGVALRRGLLNPFEYGLYALVLLSHKVLRRLIPATLPALLLASVFLAPQALHYRAALWGQAMFYTLAGVGYLTRGVAAGRSKLLYAPFYFCLANAAALVALVKFASGRKISRWEPERGDAASLVGGGAPGRGTGTGTGATRAPGEAPSVAGTSSSGGGVSPGGSPLRAASTNGVSPDRIRLDGGGPPAAVVVGLDTSTGLQSARVLTARGIPVIGVAHDPRDPCCRTRACQRVVRADTTGPELIEALVQLGVDQDERAVLLPCTDDGVLLVSRHRAELEPWFHLALPEPELVELLVDKSLFYAFAQASGFRVPSSVVLRDRDDAEEAAAHLDFPRILKPALKTAAWRRRSAAKAYRLGSGRALMELYDKVAPGVGPLVLQEWIPGADRDHYTCNGYFGRGAEPLVTFTSRKLRQWPPTGGEGCLSEEADADFVRDETVRFFQNVGHRGLGYLEMKQHEVTGEHVILEANVGRPTGRSAQAEASGVPLLYTLYCDAVGWPLPPPRPEHAPRVKWIHYRRDFQAALHHWRKGELTLEEWARSWRGPKQDALFSLSDPVPFFGDLARVARKVARRGPRRPTPPGLRTGEREAAAR